ncbi:hypothetical protein D3C80_879690 [compost metagenome]
MVLDVQQHLSTVVGQQIELSLDGLDINLNPFTELIIDRLKVGRVIHQRKIHRGWIEHSC